MKPFNGRYGSKRRVLFRYLVTYLIIVTVLFAAMGSFSYFNIVKAGRENVKAEMEQAVKRVVSAMDTNLRDVLTIQSSFYTNSDISRLRKLGMKFESKEFLRFLDMSNTLTRYTSTSLFMDRLTLYFHFNHLFIASDMLDSRPEVFYKLKYSGEHISSYTQWREIQMQAKSGVFYVTKDSMDGYVELYYRLPFMDVARGATVIAGLRVGDLIDNLGLFEEYRNSALILMDGNNNLLFTNHEMAVAFLDIVALNPENTSVILNGESYEWRSEKLSLLDWTVIYFVSTNDIYADNRQVQLNLVSLYLLMLVTSFFLSFIFSKSISDPVASLLHIVSDWEKPNGMPPKRGSVLRYVLGQVSDMTKDYSRLSTKIQEYRDSSREVIYSRMLKGEVIHQEEMRMMEGENSILDYSSYTVAAARIMAFDSSAIDMAMFTASEVLSEKRENGLFFCKTAFDRFVLIMCFSITPDREEISNIISPLFKEIYVDSNVSLRWGIGETVMNYDQIFISYRNAEYALYNMDALGREDVVWYDNVANKNRLAFSLDDAQRLSNIISGGDAEAAIRAVKELTERNKAVLTASTVQRDRFISVLSETALLLEEKFAGLDCEQIRQIELNIRNMKGADNIDTIMQYMSMVINAYCSSIGLRNEYRYQKLNEKIAAYIDEHYNDPNLGLASIAQSLRLTESYISSYFKQSSGTNIHKHIERKRMARAAELLKDTDLGTVEIVERIGYNNINTFYKAFKRYYGITPKEYRESGK